jgi:hypothetical protein
MCEDAQTQLIYVCTLVTQASELVGDEMDVSDKNKSSGQLKPNNTRYFYNLSGLLTKQIRYIRSILGH